MTRPTSRPASVQELVERYNDAYNDHDIEAILALQTHDSEYRVHGGGEGAVMKWAGIEECRRCYTDRLRMWPDQRLVTTSLVISGDLYVCNQMLTGTLVLPWQMAGRTYQPTGRPCTFEIVHIVQCKDNLVRIKDGWIDRLAIHNQLMA